MGRLKNFVTICICLKGLSILTLGEDSLASSLQVECDGAGNLNNSQYDNQSIQDFQSKSVLMDSILKSIADTCKSLATCKGVLESLQANVSNNVEVLSKIASESIIAKPTDFSDRESLVGYLDALKSSLNQCELGKPIGDLEKGRLITVLYPYKGPNRTKQSSFYDKSRLEEVIKLAVINEVDPNLALGILLMENPPVLSNNKNAEKRAKEDDAKREYAQGYGLLPIDAMAAYDYLGCAVAKSSPGKYRFVTQKEADRINTDQKNIDDVQLASDELDKEIESNLKNPKYKNLDHLDDFETLYSEQCTALKLNTPQRLPIDMCKSLKKVLDLGEKSLDLRRVLDKDKDSLGGGDPIKRELGIRELSCGNKCAGFLVPQRLIPTIEVKTDLGPTKTHKLCTSTRTILYGGHPQLDYYLNTGVPITCCANVESSTSINPDWLAIYTRTTLALKFMSQKIHSRKDPDLTISNLIQTYNGTGCFGCTEKGFKNDCLNGLNMGKTPVYGARVADLMVNSIMSNPQIQEMIRRTSAEFGTPVKSLFCEKMGSGKHQIESNSFLEEQRKYLLENGSQRKDSCESQFK